MAERVALQDVRALSRRKAWAVPSVIFPVLAALPLAVAGVALSSPLCVGVSVALTGFAAARMAYRFTMGHAAVQEASLAELQQEFVSQHEMYLRELRRRLREDRDPRTGECVKRLQRVSRRLQTLRGQETRRDLAASWGDAQDGMQQIYDQCLSSLERTWELWEGARRLAGAAAREQALAARDDLVQEVQTSIQQLERGLDQWQVAVHDSAGSSQESAELLDQLRKELDARLEVARSVDERMSRLEDELHRKIDPLGGEREG